MATAIIEATFECVGQCLLLLLCAMGAILCAPFMVVGWLLARGGLWE